MMRRNFLKTVAVGSLLLGLAGGFSAPAWAGDEIKVVYHLADGNEQAERALGNLRNHLRAEPNARIVVVALGDGIKFLLEGATDHNGKSFAAAVAALAAQGVEFRVCNNTLAAHGIAASRVVLEAKIVPAGVVEIARLQAKEGYVYLRP
jgi:intracellular sulfur oxidation DsrE/DsrF family protein